ncbi:hypothetical protein [Streptomyces sp. NPDC014685]|uniref:hypothetical protein n=1 Tax=Streptomyces sp. NPDC014685 TaxID=3364881 RepID=UPI0036FB0A80
MRHEERAKTAVVRALVPAGILVLSPMLLIAGAPIRRRHLRHVHRDGAPPLIDKERGQVGVHWFVVTSPLLGLLCRPTEWLARLVPRRSRKTGRGRGPKSPGPAVR